MTDTETLLPPPPPPVKRSKRPWFVAGGVVVALLALLGVALAFRDGSASGPSLAKVYDQTSKNTGPIVAEARTYMSSISTSVADDMAKEKGQTTDQFLAADVDLVLSYEKGTLSIDAGGVSSDDGVLPVGAVGLAGEPQVLDALDAPLQVRDH